MQVATVSVKRPVLAGKKIVPTRSGTRENTQRYSDVMNRSMLTTDPLEYARNRARQGRTAATDAVNAGRSVAPQLSGKYVESAQRVQSTAITYPCMVTTRFVTDSGHDAGTETFEVSVPSITDDSGRVVPAKRVDVALSRFRIPRGYDAVGNDSVTCAITSEKSQCKGSATLVVAPSTPPLDSAGDVHTVQATPVMLVEGVRFPARKPWEFSTRTDSADIQHVRSQLRAVMDVELRQSIPQVKVSDVIWADDHASADVLLEHCPNTTMRAEPGTANTIPGGAVLGAFPAGYRWHGGTLSERERQWFFEISRALTEEIARSAQSVRAERGLEPLTPYSLDSSNVDAVIAWCERTAQSKSTIMTNEHEQVLNLIGRTRCAEVLYPRRSRRGDDSVRTIADVFVRNAHKAVQRGGKSALLSGRATGVTAGIVVYEVDEFSRTYELSVSVMVHS